MSAILDVTRPIIIGNWKQNTSRGEALALAQALAAGVVPSISVGVCPPMIWLVAIGEAIAGSGIAIGAQTVSDRPNGAFTGEVSATMVAEVASFTLVGHSERRQHFGETDAVVADKLRLALAAGLSIVLCVGETAAQRDQGLAGLVVAEQLNRALGGLSGAGTPIVVAYEPVWAIGTGRSATPDDAAEMATSIADTLSELLPGQRVPILYGGSVTAANAADLFHNDTVDGFLVGGACLRAAEFLAIAHATVPGD